MDDPTISIPLRQSHRGILYFAIALAMLTVLNSLAKHLVQTLPPMQVAWVRYVVQAIILAGFVRYFVNTGFSLRHEWRLQFLRGLMLLGIIVSVYLALKDFPLAETAMIVAITPILLTMLAGIFLHERVTLFQWGVVVLGFSGAAFVLQPGGAIFTPAALFAVITAACFAVQQLNTRQLFERALPWHTVLYTVIVGTVLLSPPALLGWKAPNASEWLFLIANGVVAVFADLFLVKAFANARASTLAPVQYLSIIYALIIGALFFGETPGPVASIGAVVIVGSGMMLLRGDRPSQQP